MGTQHHARRLARGLALVADLLQAIAAKAPEDGKPCVAYLGPRSAGHYVKMVHNGIEYGDMQLIAEAYDILHQALGLEAAELADIFDEWNQGELDSYLIDITAQIFRKIDDLTGKPLVDLVLDTAQQKGTGKWTSQDSFNIGAPMPTINTAVVERIISEHEKRTRGRRGRAARPRARLRRRPPSVLIDGVRQALYASKISAYAQGMAMLRIASHEYGYELEPGRDSLDLARRLHHPRPLPQPHHRRLCAQRRPAQPAARRRLHPGGERAAAGLALRRADCRGLGHSGAGL